MWKNCIEKSMLKLNLTFGEKFQTFRVSEQFYLCSKKNRLSMYGVIYIFQVRKLF